MQQFVQVKHTDSGEVGKVPARSVPRWLGKGYELADPETALPILESVGVDLDGLDLPANEPETPSLEVVDVQPVPPSDPDSASAPESLEPAEAAVTPEVVDPTGDLDTSVETPEPGTAADPSADTTSTTSGRRRGGAAGNAVR